MIRDLSNNIGVSLGALLGGFFVECLQHMVIWLVVMVVITLCDLVAKVSYLVKSRGIIRISKGVRNTLTKLCTYFSAVVGSCVFSVSIGADGTIERGVVIIICVVESVSIFGNLLKLKGYEINSTALVRAILSKVLPITKDETKDIIIKKK